MTTNTQLQAAGDYNLDGSVNVTDLVAITFIVLGGEASSVFDWQNWSNLNLMASDINQDGVLDILDIVTIVQVILGNEDITEVEV